MFGAAFANVQPHSGAQANQAVFLALLQPGDRIMGMNLAHGGHLTHGSPVTMSGKWFDVVSYEVREDNQRIDMDAVRARALETKPKLIIAGASAYPREIDFAGFRAIADEVGAYLMVDMAHYAGLIAAGKYPNPVPHAHVVTSTTHKTLRGPRGGVILTNDEALAKKLNSAVFPGNQGGPLMHVIAAKAVAFGEALQPSFKDYAGQVIANARALAAAPAGGRARHRLGRHRLPHGPRRPAPEGGQGPRRRAGAGARRAHLQQERDPLRSGKALRDLGRAPRDLRRNHPRLRDVRVHPRRRAGPEGGLRPRRRRPGGRRRRGGRSAGGGPDPLRRASDLRRLRPQQSLHGSFPAVNAAGNIQPDQRLDPRITRETA
ncbi:hypothetical protein CNY89_06530 [Amaricoccus sp. HAR-UPW-R2A-40]|nr:hypothetical protein CNY89_06530 [Amaricoccus sp. HAR-UPW-R2A-40]